MSTNLLVAAFIVGICGTLGSMRLFYQADNMSKTKHIKKNPEYVDTYNLKWAKYFFVYHNMRQGKIIKFIFWVYIALYINTVLFISAVIGANITHAFPFQLLTVIFGFASIAIIIITSVIADSIDKLIYQKQHKQLWNAAQAQSQTELAQDNISQPDTANKTIKSDESTPPDSDSSDSD